MHLSTRTGPLSTVKSCRTGQPGNVRLHTRLLVTADELVKGVSFSPNVASGFSHDGAEGKFDPPNMKRKRWAESQRESQGSSAPTAAVTRRKMSSTRAARWWAARECDWGWGPSSCPHDRGRTRKSCRWKQPTARGVSLPADQSSPFCSSRSFVYVFNHRSRSSSRSSQRQLAIRIAFLESVEALGIMLWNVAPPLLRLSERWSNPA